MKSSHPRLAQALGDQMHKTFQGVKLKGYFPFFQMTQWNLKNNTVHPAPFYFFFQEQNIAHMLMVDLAELIAPGAAWWCWG